MDEGFLGNIDGPFICLTAAILCNSLRCWRTGDFIDNVPFTQANCAGNMNSAYLWFSKVSRSLGAQASGYFENRKYSTQVMGRLTRKQACWIVR